MRALLETIAAMPLPVDACRIFHARRALSGIQGMDARCLSARLGWAVTCYVPASGAQLVAIDSGAAQAR